MDWKKWTMTALASGTMVLAGCPGPSNTTAGGGGTASGGGGGGTIFVDSGETPACDPSTAGAEAAVFYAIDDIDIPDSNAVGFNLDGAITRSPRTEAGCGKIDGPMGEDNQLVSLLSALGELIEGTDIDTLIDEAIADGTIDLSLELVGYDGTDDDTCVAVRVFSGEEAVAGPFGASVEGGSLRTRIDSLPLAIPFPGEEGADPVLIELDITNARLEVPLTSGAGVIGGAVTYQGNLRPEIGDLITIISDSITLETIDGIVNPQLDYQSDGSNAGACDAISLGLTIGVSAEQ